MKEYKSLPSIDFGESVKMVLTNLLNFNGRARRSELWWYYMLYTIVAMVVKFTLTAFPIIAAIVALVLQSTLWSVTVRRLHDRGHSGLWVGASVLTSIASDIYMFQSGYYEVMNTVNTSIEEATAILRGPEFLSLALLSIIINITIFVFCVLDSKPGRNKYGESPKYIEKDIYVKIVTNNAQ